VGEADAPDGRCTPIPKVMRLIQKVWGYTYVTCVVGLGKESLSRSCSMSSMVHVEGIFC
jgi:hypothetical protein